MDDYSKEFSERTLKVSHDLFPYEQTSFECCRRKSHLLILTLLSSDARRLVGELLLFDLAAITGGTNVDDFSLAGNGGGGGEVGEFGRLGSCLFERPRLKNGKL